MSLRFSPHNAGDVARNPNWGGKKSKLNHYQSHKTDTSRSIFDYFGQICHHTWFTRIDTPMYMFEKIVWMHGFAIIHNIRKTVQMWKSSFWCSFWCPVAELWSGGVFSIYPGHSVEGRQNWMEAGGFGGKGGISDINLLCPLTLQRRAVNQSKPSLFQKALFDHAG